MTRQMILGLSLDGQTAGDDFAAFAHQAREAERGVLHFLSISDDLGTPPAGAGRIEPISLMSGLSAVTSSIGLAVTITPACTEPYNTARFFASLDLISGGRSAWNFSAGIPENAARDFGPIVPPPLHLAMAEEHLDVVQGLWDTWEDDTMVQDKRTGVFLDPDKLHTLDHKRKFYQVMGPLNLSRSPQGQPVIFHPDPPPAEHDLAARRADVILITPASPQEAAAICEDLKHRAIAAGRDPARLSILAHLPNPDADTLRHWFTATPLDGFMITATALPTFVDTVLPTLRSQGLFRTTYAGQTLRENLGLPKPRSRFAKPKP